MSDPRLCIIGGSPRSGTRNFADLVSAHPASSLFGEVGHYALPNVKRLVAEVASYHTDEERRQAEHGRLRAKNFKSHQVALVMTALHAKTPKIPFDFQSLSTSNIVGFKTPKIERRWRIIVELFSGFTSEKIFFYTIRNIEENYLSLHSMGWVKSLDEYIFKLKSSLGAALEFQRWSERDGSWQVRALHLNSFIVSTDKSAWLKQHVFSLIAPDCSHQEISKFVSSSTNRNSTLKATGTERRKRLTDEERDKLYYAAELSQLIDQINDSFKVDVSILSLQ